LRLIKNFQKLLLLVIFDYYFAYTIKYNLAEKLWDLMRYLDREIFWFAYNILYNHANILWDLISSCELTEDLCLKISDEILAEILTRVSLILNIKFTLCEHFPISLFLFYTFECHQESKTGYLQNSFGYSHLMNDKTGW